MAYEKKLMKYSQVIGWRTNMIWLISFVIFCVILVACNSKSELVGVWYGKEGFSPLLGDITPAFNLNSDGSARIFQYGVEYNGTWSFKENIVIIQYSGKFLKLEKSGNQLTTLPNRSFTFERR